MSYTISVYKNTSAGGTVNGGGTYESGQTVTLIATANTGYRFLYWRKGSSIVTREPTYEFICTGDASYTAYFEQIYNITTSDDGHGSIGYTRSESNQNIVEFYVIPDTNYHFLKYVVTKQYAIVSTEYTTTPLQLTLDRNITVEAYFEIDDKIDVRPTSNVDYASIYVSETPVFAGTTVMLYARPLADYYFSRWDDGVTDNPREIVVNAQDTYMAIYHRIADEPNIYPYRCYIKDQLHLTDAPKSFLKVESFDVKTDLMTNANSSINVVDVSTNINNGDVLVLYDPRGTTIYQGVIKSIQDKQITCSQMQSYYKGNWVYNHHTTDSLEKEIRWLLNKYSQGIMYGSSWTDTLVAQRLGGITVQYVGTTSASLPTDKDYTVVDMEKFIYSLYEDYGIILDFEINFSGTNYVTVKVPDYDTIKVGNNMYAINNMSPITQIEETNRLIIYASDHTYRTTYVATANEIVETPSTNANRFNITNTKIVFSDDDVSDLVSANLPATMYNHKLTFNLLVKNFIYEFGDFHLGGTLDVWHGQDYYNTVLTGYEIKKNTNQNITEVGFTCGKVRTALTKKLTLGVV